MLRLEPGPLEGQLVLLTAEPTLWPHLTYFCWLGGCEAWSHIAQAGLKLIKGDLELLDHLSSKSSDHRCAPCLASPLFEF